MLLGKGMGAETLWSQVEGWTPKLWGYPGYPCWCRGVWLVHFVSYQVFGPGSGAMICRYEGMPGKASDDDLMGCSVGKQSKSSYVTI